MKIIKAETWDVTGSGTREILFNKNKIGDVVASELYLNPIADCTIVVKGYVGEDDATGITLKAVDIANLEKKSSVTTAGDYMYLVGSFYKVSVAVTGTAKVQIKYLF